MSAQPLPSFEWITIPAGPVTLEAGGYLPETTSFDVETFAIARYPVTNAQYATFIAAGGYTDRQWWTDSGWTVKGFRGWSEPRFWGDELGSDCPVIGISWHEAVAFCRWLSTTTGELITLPTEQQWQRAAQGDDGRDYPWGNALPDATRCNWNRQADGTTPVTSHPRGASPYGVMDMCGNAWEYCRTGWDTGTTGCDGRERRIVRGGCWVNDSPITLLTTLRDGPYPADGYHLVGLRCTRPV